MGSICILTDNAAQFTQPGFAGREDVWQLSFSVRLNGSVYPDDETIKSTSLPVSAGDGLLPTLLVPDVRHIQETLHDLAGKYREIIAILTSSELTPLFTAVEQASLSIRGKIPVTLIDSQSIALGLGLMVQSAAEAAARGVNGVEIERSIRRMIPRTYSLFASAGLSYLYHAGYIDEGQAAIGEMLGILPIFSLEEGKLSAIEKARNPRGVLDFFQEFLDEFDHLQQIAFLQGAAPFNHEAHLLREHAQIHFGRTPFTEHTINLPTAVQFGPRTLGLAILDGE
jgi:DegV family protein with EDD domain